MAKQKLVCIFCGGNSGAKLSKEHLWSEWMHGDLFAKDDNKRLVVRSDQSLTTEITFNPVPTRQGHALTTTFRGPCEACNSGWMNRIEQAARPTLTSMIRGEAITLSLSMQRDVANWITLKTIIGEFTDPRTIAITQDERRQFYEEKNPPSHWRIYLSPLSAPNWNLRYTHYGSAINDSARHSIDTRNTQVTSFGLGGLFVLVASSTSPVVSDYPQFCDVVAEQIYLTRLFPAGLHDEFLWPSPPYKFFSDDDAEIASLIISQKLSQAAASKNGF